MHCMRQVYGPVMQSEYCPAVNLATSEDAADRKGSQFYERTVRIVDMKRWYLCPQVRVADIAS